MQKDQRTVVRALLVATTIFALACFESARVGADEVTVKGTVLRGKVVNVTASDIEFETEYGKGNLIIPIADVEDVQSDGSFHVLYGEDGEAQGRFVGIREGSLLVGEGVEGATAVDPAAIHMTHSAEDYEQVGLGLVRRTFALWTGGFDLGFGLTQATTDTTGLAVGFTADRKKKPSRVTLQSGYRYGTQKEKDEDRSTLENEIKGLLRGEYDVLPRTYVFGAGDAEYDEIQRISFRGVPTSGLGYRLWDTDDGLFQLEAGGAYVYENFFGSETNDYFAIAFGKLLEATLPYYGSKFQWRTDYLPSVSDWAGDYLLRTEASLLIPMVEFLNFKLSVGDQYDSTPAEGSNKNTLNTTAGVSLVY